MAGRVAAAHHASSKLIPGVRAGGDTPTHSATATQAYEGLPALCDRPPCLPQPLSVSQHRAPPRMQVHKAGPHRQRLRARPHPLRPPPRLPPALPRGGSGAKGSLLNGTLRPRPDSGSAPALPHRLQALPHCPCPAVRGRRVLWRCCCCCCWCAHRGGRGQWRALCGVGALGPVFDLRQNAPHTLRG